MEALHDLVKSGKVRYIGASSMWATQFAQMQFVAEKNGWTKFVSMQNQYSLLYREEEREMNRFCRETGVGLIPVCFSLFSIALFSPKPLPIHLIIPFHNFVPDDCSVGTPLPRPPRASPLRFRPNHPLQTRSRKRALRRRQQNHRSRRGVGQEEGLENGTCGFGVD